MVPIVPYTQMLLYNRNKLPAVKDVLKFIAEPK